MSNPRSEVAIFCFVVAVIVFILLDTDKEDFHII
jgi:hypothetical protein